MGQIRYIRMLAIWGVGTAATTAYAQGVTYNHDPAKKNQIMVMETGGGSLTPELYYWTFHKNYKKSAARKNKLTYRTVAGLNAYNQVAYAENIDSALTSRAAIEALNVADRQIDLAWTAEGNKIEAAMARFKQNIDRIMFVGGTANEKLRWTEYYNMYNCAINATRMPICPMHSERKNTYASMMM